MQRLRDLRRPQGLESLAYLVTATVTSAIELAQVTGEDWDKLPRVLNISDQRGVSGSSALNEEPVEGEKGRRAGCRSYIVQGSIRLMFDA